MFLFCHITPMNYANIIHYLQMNTANEELWYVQSASVGFRAKSKFLSLYLNVLREGCTLLLPFHLCAPSGWWVFPGQAVYSVLSCLPQGQCHWNCSKPASFLCLGRGLGRSSQFPPVPPALSVQSGAQRCVCSWVVFCRKPVKHTWAWFLPVGLQYSLQIRSWNWGTWHSTFSFLSLCGRTVPSH